MISIIKEFLIYSNMSELHSSVDPNSQKNIINRLGLSFPGKNWDDLMDIAAGIRSGNVKEENVTLKMVKQSMEQHRINNPDMFAEENAEDLLLYLVDGKKIEIKVWMGIVKGLNCPGISFDPPLSIEGIDPAFNNVKDNVTEAIKDHFIHIAKENDRIIDTGNIEIIFNKSQEEFDQERVIIKEADTQQKI